MGNCGRRYNPMIDTKQANRKRHAAGCEANADEALEAARNMPPGPERNDVLKKAGALRNDADALASYLPGAVVRRVNIQGKCDAIERECHLPHC